MMTGRLGPKGVAQIDASLRATERSNPFLSRQSAASEPQGAETKRGVLRPSMANQVIFSVAGSISAPSRTILLTCFWPSR